MFPIERREKIIAFLEKNGSITVEELAIALEVTPATIRRDLKYLEENNKITRTFGGAVVREGLVEDVAVAKKATAFQKEKKAIAKASANMLEDGQTIILDAGTTNMELARVLSDSDKRISIITDDILIAVALLETSNIDVYCTGGHVQKNVGICLGNHAEAFFENINADLAFIGASAVDMEKGISSPSLEKAALKRQLMKCARQRILVSDSSKFERVSFAKVCSIEDFDKIITDQKISDENREEIRARGIELLIV